MFFPVGYRRYGIESDGPSQVHVQVPRLHVQLDVTMATDWQCGWKDLYFEVRNKGLSRTVNFQILLPTWGQSSILGFNCEDGWLTLGWCSWGRWRWPWTNCISPCLARLAEAVSRVTPRNPPWKPLASYTTRWLIRINRLPEVPRGPGPK